jgi:gamma-D-glutamyl-L-lysine dipeptidyl-peptidase
MSEYFIAKNIANIMKESNPDSALDSQAIAGTIVTVEKRENDYCYVKTPDLYHGWVAERRLVEAWDRSSYESACVKSLFAPVYAKPDETSPLLTKLVISTRVFFTREIDNFIEILLPDKQIAYMPKICIEVWENSGADKNKFEEKWRRSKEQDRTKIIIDLGQRVVEIAKLFMGTPYLWGGCTPFGMDCSGMV